MVINIYMVIIIITGFNLFHSGLAVYTTYGILKYLGGSSLAVFIIFVFNIVYLFCGMKK